MSNLLELFRTQREEVEQIHARLKQVVELLRAIRSEATALARDEPLRKLLQEEQAWLLRAEDLIRQVQSFRELEARRYWPAILRRWVVASIFALAAAAAFGAGHVWASRPYETELASLRLRVEVMDSLAARILTMSPAERREFDALIQGKATPRR